MGIFSKIALMGIESNLKKLLKEKRLVFLNDKQVDYTNQEGVKREISFDDMADVFILVGGAQNVAAAGVTTEDIRKLIIKAYQKGVE